MLSFQRKISGRLFRAGLWLLAGVWLAIAAACGGAETDELDSLRESRALLRAYDGAPPVVPHEIESTLYKRCLYCHKEGKILGDQVATATPHPEMKNCRQCHVPLQTDDLFVKNSFQPYRITTRLVGQNPAGPPKIPHRLQYREKCEACHLGESAPEAIKPRHGERTNCVQCHVR